MSIFRLKKIAELIGEDDGAWLLNGIERYKSGERLDVALGLCGSAALIHRNLLLKKAANILNINGEYSTSCVAGLLQKALTRFESRVFPKYRKNKNLELSEVDMIFLEMFQLDCRVAKKRRQLFNCIS